MAEIMESLLNVPDTSANDELLPIREVVRLTGVNPVTLRAWERRYGLIIPLRTEGGHRLYTQEDVATIRDIMGWTERGLAVSKVGSLLARRKTERAAVCLVTATTAEDFHSSEQQISQCRLDLRNALQAFDEARLEQLYGQIFATYPLPMVFEDVLLPVWQEYSSLTGFGQASQWLFYDAFLRVRLMQRLHMHRHAAQRTVLLAALPEQCRELELWVNALLLSDDAVRVSVLPIGQVLEEIPLVCEALKPSALVLLATVPPAHLMMRQLEKLAMSVDCPMALAGVGAELVEEQLQGSAIGNLGAQFALMRNRLKQLVEGHLDT